MPQRSDQRRQDAWTCVPRLQSLRSLQLFSCLRLPSCLSLSLIVFDGRIVISLLKPSRERESLRAILAITRTQAAPGDKCARVCVSLSLPLCVYENMWRELG